MAYYKCFCGKRFSKKVTRNYKFCPTHSEEMRNLTGRDRVREMVRIRDKRTCQTCGKKWELSMRRFDVHHLNGICGKKSKGYDKAEDMEGLITLCHKCHIGKHVDKEKFRTFHRRHVRVERKEKMGISPLIWDKERKIFL